jgi:hypothetical protein
VDKLKLRAKETALGFGSFIEQHDLFETQEERLVLKEPFFLVIKGIEPPGSRQLTQRKTSVG